MKRTHFGDAVPEGENFPTFINIVELLLLSPCAINAMSEPVSNVRPISILAAYMITAIALTASCISIIRRKKLVVGHASSRLSSPRRSAIPFAVLAAVSLATTWYYMFCYFRWSYLDWASKQSLHDSTALHLGQWLCDTLLFKQAWASTVETPLRTWWSSQIFGFCAVWSIALAVQGKSRCRVLQ
jgi:hypothetical protein